MKPKYVFYIVLLFVLHYEISRLVNCMQPRDTDEASYDKGVKLWIRNDDVKTRLNYHPRVVNVVITGKKRISRKNRNAGVLYARTYPARAKR